VLCRSGRLSCCVVLTCAVLWRHVVCAVCREFSEMSEAQQEALLQQKANLVFSRAEPKHKQVRLNKQVKE